MIWQVHRHHVLAESLSRDRSSSQQPFSMCCRPQLLVFPLYYTFMKVASLVLCLRSILVVVGSTKTLFSVANLLVVNPIVRFRSDLVVDPLTSVSVLISSQGSAVEDSVSFFMTQNSSGDDAVRKTWRFALLWCFVQFAVGLSMVLLFGKDAGALVNFVPTMTVDVYWIIFDGSFVLSV